MVGWADVALVGLGVVATMALSWTLLRGAWDSLGTAIAVAACVALALTRTRLSHVRLHSVLAALAALLPFLAVLGPTLSVPGGRPLFAFRMVLALLALLGMCRVLLGSASLTLGPRGLRAVLALWYAWMVVTLLWAPDKPAGLEYLLTTATMLALTFSVAACAERPRYLGLALWLLAVALCLTIFLAAAELATGWHLPGSAEALSTSGFKATAWFVNTNDLATCFSICWPFLLLGVFATRRPWLRTGALLLLGAMALMLLFTGSRTSLVTVGLETIVAGFLAVRCGWLTGRRLFLAGLLLLALVGGMAALLLNESEAPILRQFRLAAVAEDVQTGQGSGDVRLDLARAGFAAANRFFYAGVGPGNAEDLTKQSEDVSVAFGNLHSWWFEVFVNAGLPGFVLFALFFGGCIVVAGRAMRSARNRTDAWLAAAVLTALIGFVVGAFGPSTAASFAPMWILYGLALAVAVRARRAAPGHAEAGAPPVSTARRTCTAVAAGVALAPPAAGCAGPGAEERCSP